MSSAERTEIHRFPLRFVENAVGDLIREGSIVWQISEQTGEPVAFYVEKIENGPDGNPILTMTKVKDKDPLALIAAGEEISLDGRTRQRVDNIDKLLTQKPGGHDDDIPENLFIAPEDREGGAEAYRYEKNRETAIALIDKLAPGRSIFISEGAKLTDKLLNKWKREFPLCVKVLEDADFDDVLTFTTEGASKFDDLNHISINLDVSKDTAKTLKEIIEKEIHKQKNLEAAQALINQHGSELNITLDARELSDTELARMRSALVRGARFLREKKFKGELVLSTTADSGVESGKITINLSEGSNGFARIKELLQEGVEAGHFNVGEKAEKPKPESASEIRKRAAALQESDPAAAAELLKKLVDEKYEKTLPDFNFPSNGTPEDSGDGEYEVLGPVSPLNPEPETDESVQPKPRPPRRTLGYGEDDQRPFSPEAPSMSSSDFEKGPEINHNEVKATAHPSRQTAIGPEIDDLLGMLTDTPLEGTDVTSPDTPGIPGSVNKHQTRTPSARRFEQAIQRNFEDETPDAAQRRRLLEKAYAEAKTTPFSGSPLDTEPSIQAVPFALEKPVKEAPHILTGADTLPNEPIPPEALVADKAKSLEDEKSPESEPLPDLVFTSIEGNAETGTNRNHCEIHHRVPFAQVDGMTDFGGKISKYPSNEDAILYRQRGDVILVIAADGAGGHGSKKADGGQGDGDLASRRMVEHLSKNIFDNSQSPFQALQNMDEYMARKNEEASRHADFTVGTLAAAHITRDLSVDLLFVGDAKATTIREGAVLPEGTSRLDNIAQYKVDKGHVDPKDYYNHEEKSVILSAAGGRTRDIAHASNEGRFHSKFQGQANDRIVLCSDGLVDVISEYEILKLSLESDTADQLKQKLFDLAMHRYSTREPQIEHAPGVFVTLERHNRSDNITIVVVELKNEEEKKSDETPASPETPIKEEPVDLLEPDVQVETTSPSLERKDTVVELETYTDPSGQQWQYKVGKNPSTGEVFFIETPNGKNIEVSKSADKPTFVRGAKRKPEQVFVTSIDIASNTLVYRVKGKLLRRGKDVQMSITDFENMIAI
ncbi:hypothetical protein H6758_03250 [Candidatus Nomurabacteria bacterium]|nr:hypothetical protein [Candidatus Nomurabacteria bacterium]